MAAQTDCIQRSARIPHANDARTPIKSRLTCPLDILVLAVDVRRGLCVAVDLVQAVLRVALSTGAPVGEGRAAWNEQANRLQQRKLWPVL